MNVYQFLCMSFFPFDFEGGKWDLIILIPDHCLSICLRCGVWLSFVILVRYKNKKKIGRNRC